MATQWSFLFFGVHPASVEVETKIWLINLETLRGCSLLSVGTRIHCASWCQVLGVGVDGKWDRSHGCAVVVGFSWGKFLNTVVVDNEACNWACGFNPFEKIWSSKWVQSSTKFLLTYVKKHYLYLPIANFLFLFGYLILRRHVSHAKPHGFELSAPFSDSMPRREPNAPKITQYMKYLAGHHA